MRPFSVQNFSRSNLRLINYLVEIILLHTLPDALSVEELNMLVFNGGSTRVCFVYRFLQITTNIKILVVSVLIHILRKGPTKIFPLIIKKFVFFTDILRIFDFFRVI